jgi:hypothetical protein
VFEPQHCKKTKPNQNFIPSIYICESAQKNLQVRAGLSHPASWCFSGQESKGCLSSKEKLKSLLTETSSALGPPLTTHTTGQLPPTSHMVSIASHVPAAASSWSVSIASSSRKHSRQPLGSPFSELDALRLVYKHMGIRRPAHQRCRL